MLRNRNLIGPLVIKFRYEHGWTQDKLVSELQLIQVYITRDIVANIELQRCTVPDNLVRAFAIVFGVLETNLFPPRGQRIQNMSQVDELSARRRSRPGTK